MLVVLVMLVVVWNVAWKCCLSLLLVVVIFWRLFRLLLRVPLVLVPFLVLPSVVVVVVVYLVVVAVVAVVWRWLCALWLLWLL